MNERPDTAAGPDAAPTPPLPPLPRPSRWPAFLAVLALGAVLALVGVGQYFWMGMQQRLGQLRGSVDQAAARQQEMAQRIDEASRAFADQQRRLQEQDTLVRQQAAAIAARERSLAEAETRLGHQEQAVRQTLDNLHREVGRSGQAWRAAEAAYLVELARQRLALERDRATAITALTSAEERLKETGDPRYLPVRERLTADVAALRAVPEADRDALSRDLTRMAAGVDLLPMPTSQMHRRQPPGGGAAPRGERSLDTLWEDGLRGLQSLVQVRRSDVPLGPLADPAEPQALIQGLRLQLESARFGLLRRDAQLYDSGLATAQVWLATFFDGQRPEVRLYLDDIARLRAAPVAPPLPDLQPTLQALRALLDAEGTGK